MHTHSHTYTPDPNPAPRPDTVSTVTVSGLGQEAPPMPAGPAPSSAPAGLAHARSASSPDPSRCSPTPVPPAGSTWALTPSSPSSSGYPSTDAWGHSCRGPEGTVPAAAPSTRLFPSAHGDAAFPPILKSRRNPSLPLPRATALCSKHLEHVD